MAPRTEPSWPETDYEFICDWTPRIRVLLYAKVRAQDVEDGTQEILTYLLAGHYRENWDRVRPWAPYMYGMVRYRIKDFIRNLQIKSVHESTASSVRTNEDEDWHFDPADPNSEDPSGCCIRVFLVDEIRMAMNTLSCLPRTPTQQFDVLFTCMLAQIASLGYVNDTQLAETYGVKLSGRPFSRQAVSAQREKLARTEVFKRLKAALLIT